MFLNNVFVIKSIMILELYSRFKVNFSKKRCMRIGVETIKIEQMINVLNTLKKNKKIGLYCV